MKKMPGIFTLVTIIAALIFYVMYSAKNYEAPITEVDMLITYDLDEKYPTTPREVVRLYSRILQKLYSESLSNDQINGLGIQLRGLFAETFLSENPEETYLVDLKQEINDYQDKNRTIIDYKLKNTTSSDYMTIDEKEYSSVKVIFELYDKSSIDLKVFEEFLLIKDENELWKIKGYRKVDPFE